MGALSISYTDLAKEYRAIVSDLKRRLALGFGAGGIRPYAGGISVADKEVQREDDDWDKPSFIRGIHDNLGTEDHQPELASWST